MDRYRATLPTGIIKHPKTVMAGCDFEVNDVVVRDGDTVYPMYSEDQKMYGVCAARGIKGKPVLLATGGE